METKNWLQLKHSEPDIVIFMLGSNDGKGENWNKTKLSEFEAKYSSYLSEL